MKRIKPIYTFADLRLDLKCNALFELLRLKIDEIKARK